VCSLHSFALKGIVYRSPRGRRSAPLERHARLLTDRSRRSGDPDDRFVDPAGACRTIASATQEWSPAAASDECFATNRSVRVGGAGRILPRGSTRQEPAVRDRARFCIVAHAALSPRLLRSARRRCPGGESQMPVATADYVSTSSALVARRLGPIQRGIWHSGVSSRRQAAFGEETTV
jgi:cytochrome c1